MCENVYDMIIVGSGPAGLTAGIYGKRAGLKVVILESGFIQGGQIVNTYEVDNYPGMPGISGLELAEKLKEHVTGFGVEIARGKVKGISLDGEWKIVHTKKADYRGKAVILAAGAVHRKLEVPGEEELAGMGVSYCATCDGAFFKDQTVAVVGGGDVALEDALYLSNICKNVYLIHRRDGLRGAKVLQNKVMEKENITFMPFYEVTKICVQNKVEAVELKQNQTGETKTIDLSGVFIAIGMEPQSSLVKDLVKEDPAGYVEAGEDCRTSADGIYVAGDVRSKSLRQVVTAVADGAVAIASIEQDFARE